MQQEFEKPKEAVLEQNLEEKGDFQNLFQIWLLFKNKQLRPSTKTVEQALQKTFGKVTMVADTNQTLTTFALDDYMVVYKDGKMPAQVLLANFVPFEKDDITQIQRTQLWDCADPDALLNDCKYKLMISDFIAAGLPYQRRCAMLTNWLKTALDLFPDCFAIWVPSSGKVLTREQVLQNPYHEEDEFICYGVNVRFFYVQGTDDMIVDTLGLYAIGLPDIQYHFHSLDPNMIVNHAYQTAIYLYENEAPIKSGETIDGISKDGRIDHSIQWKCQYENALIQPARTVMDICITGHAAGMRKENEKEGKTK